MTGTTQSFLEALLFCLCPMQATDLLEFSLIGVFFPSNQ
jgi:hypothetical protein